MGSVVSSIGSFVGDIVEFAVDDIISPVVSAVGDVVGGMLDDPIGTILTVASFIPGPHTPYIWAVKAARAAIDGDWVGAAMSVVSAGYSKFIGPSVDAWISDTAGEVFGTTSNFGGDLAAEMTSEAVTSSIAQEVLIGAGKGAAMNVVSAAIRGGNIKNAALIGGLTGGARGYISGTKFVPDEDIDYDHDIEIDEATYESSTSYISDGLSEGTSAVRKAFKDLPDIAQDIIVDTAAAAATAAVSGGDVKLEEILPTVLTQTAAKVYLAEGVIKDLYETYSDASPEFINSRVALVNKALDEVVRAAYTGADASAAFEGVMKEDAYNQLSDGLFRAIDNEDVNEFLKDYSTKNDAYYEKYGYTEDLKDRVNNSVDKINNHNITKLHSGEIDELPFTLDQMEAKIANYNKSLDDYNERQRNRDVLQSRTVTRTGGGDEDQQNVYGPWVTAGPSNGNPVPATRKFYEEYTDDSGTHQRPTGRETHYRKHVLPQTAADVALEAEFRSGVERDEIRNWLDQHNLYHSDYLSEVEDLKALRTEYDNSFLELGVLQEAVVEASVEGDRVVAENIRPAAAKFVVHSLFPQDDLAAGFEFEPKYYNGAQRNFYGEYKDGADSSLTAEEHWLLTKRVNAVNGTQNDLAVKQLINNAIPPQVKLSLVNITDFHNRKEYNKRLESDGKESATKYREAYLNEAYNKFLYETHDLISAEVLEDTIEGFETGDAAAVTYGDDGTIVLASDLAPLAVTEAAKTVFNSTADEYAVGADWESWESAQNGGGSLAPEVLSEKDTYLTPEVIAALKASNKLVLYPPIATGIRLDGSIDFSAPVWGLAEATEDLEPPKPWGPRFNPVTNEVEKSALEEEYQPHIVRKKDSVAEFLMKADVANIPDAISKAVKTTQNVLTGLLMKKAAGMAGIINGLENSSRGKAKVVLDGIKKDWEAGKDKFGEIFSTEIVSSISTEKAPLRYGFDDNRWARILRDATPDQLATLERGLKDSDDPGGFRPLVENELARRAGGESVREEVPLKEDKTGLKSQILKARGERASKEAAIRNAIIALENQYLVLDTYVKGGFSADELVEIAKVSKDEADAAIEFINNDIVVDEALITKLDAANPSDLTAPAEAVYGAYNGVLEWEKLQVEEAAPTKTLSEPGYRLPGDPWSKEGFEGGIRLKELQHINPALWETEVTRIGRDLSEEDKQNLHPEDRALAQTYANTSDANISDKEKGIYNDLTAAAARGGADLLLAVTGALNWGMALGGELAHMAEVGHPFGQDYSATEKSEIASTLKEWAKSATAFATANTSPELKAALDNYHKLMARNVEGGGVVDALKTVGNAVMEEPYAFFMGKLLPEIFAEIPPLAISIGTGGASILVAKAAAKAQGKEAAARSVGAAVGWTTDRVLAGVETFGATYDAHFDDLYKIAIKEGFDESTAIQKAYEGATLSAGLSASVEGVMGGLDPSARVVKKLLAGSPGANLSPTKFMDAVRAGGRIVAEGVSEGADAAAGSWAHAYNINDISPETHRIRFGENGEKLPYVLTREAAEEALIGGGVGAAFTAFPTNTFFKGGLDPSSGVPTIIEGGPSGSGGYSDIDMGMEKPGGFDLGGFGPNQNEIIYKDLEERRVSEDIAAMEGVPKENEEEKRRRANVNATVNAVARYNPVVKDAIFTARTGTPEQVAAAEDTLHDILNWGTLEADLEFEQDPKGVWQHQVATEILAGALPQKYTSLSKVIETAQTQLAEQGVFPELGVPSDLLSHAKLLPYTGEVSNKESAQQVATYIDEYAGFTNLNAQQVAAEAGYTLNPDEVQTFVTSIKEAEEAKIDDDKSSLILPAIAYSAWLQHIDDRQLNSDEVTELLGGVPATPEQIAALTGQGGPTFQADQTEVVQDYRGEREVTIDEVVGELAAQGYTPPDAETDPEGAAAFDAEVAKYVGVSADPIQDETFGRIITDVDPRYILESEARQAYKDLGILDPVSADIDRFVGAGDETKLPTDIRSHLPIASYNLLTNTLGVPGQDITPNDITIIEQLIADQMATDAETGVETGVETDIETDTPTAEQLLYDVTGDNVIDQADLTMLQDVMAGTTSRADIATTSPFAATGIQGQLATQQAQQAQQAQQTQTAIQTAIANQTAADNQRRQEAADQQFMAQLLETTPVKVETPDPKKIEYVYDPFGDSIFAGPQRSLYEQASPYGTSAQPKFAAHGGLIEDETDTILRVLEGR